MSKARSPRTPVSITMGTRWSAIGSSLRSVTMQPNGCEFNRVGLVSQLLGCTRGAVMDAKARVEKRVVFPVGRREVWAALTRPDELSSWFGIDVVSLELRPAGRIVFRGADGASRRALVEIVDEPARFAFRWLPALAGGRFDRSP